tara:strand:+ start:106 stop:522 length:417 start_codon:yes stop_codon:yes gene_type:complete
MTTYEDINNRLEEFINKLKTDIDKINRMVDGTEKKNKLNTLKTYVNNTNNLIKINKNFNNLNNTSIEQGNSRLLANIKDKHTLYTNKKHIDDSINQTNTASQVLKHDVYDVNLLDNMYLTYYFLSYVVMGFVIYKLSK